MCNHKHNYTDSTVDEEGNETCEYCGVSRSRQEGEEKQDMRDDKRNKNGYG
jgi:biotin synthase-like enzyme